MALTHFVPFCSGEQANTPAAEHFLDSINCAEGVFKTLHDPWI